MRINTNVSSLTAQEAAKNTNNNITSSLEKLSTGLRINKASDDASGLAIADKLRTQATSIGQGIANGNSAIALLQIADKSMGEQSNILDTIKAKLVQANTDTTSDAGRESIRKDIQKLLTQLDNIATQTNYNGKSLLADVKDGKLTGKEASALNFQIGASNSDIISTANINSTSSSLGGGSEDISKIKAGETKTLQNGSAGTLNVSGAASKGIDVTVSGNLGNVTGKGGDLTLQTSDVAAIAKLDQLVDDGKLTAVATGVYTLAEDGSVDLSDINFTDLTISTDDTNDTKSVYFSSDSSSFKVTNNDFANDLTVSANENLEAKAETTVKAVLGENLKISTSGTSANLTISGNLGTLGTTGGQALTITVTDSATIAKLEEIAALDENDGFTSNGNGEFELAADKSIDLSTIDFESVNIKNDRGFTAGDQVFSTTSKTAITIKNNLTDGLNIENKTVESGSNLASLRNLTEGGLTQAVASNFQTVVDDAITQLNGYRGDIGSTQNQVESAVRNLQTQQTNIKAAESVIRDVDYAQESANFNKQNIISQAGSYAISQANAVQQNVLRLLQ